MGKCQELLFAEYFQSDVFNLRPRSKTASALMIIDIDIAGQSVHGIVICGLKTLSAI